MLDDEQPTDSDGKTREPRTGLADEEKRRGDRERQQSDGPDREKEAGSGEGKKGPPRPSVVRRHPIAVVLAVLGAAALAAGGYHYWLTSVHPFETTDDAFVDSRQFAVAPKVSGYVIDVPVTDNQHLGAGDTIFQIEPRDYQVTLDQNRAQVEAEKASIASADAQLAAQLASIEEAEAEVAQAEASLQFAQSDAARYQKLAQTGTGTVQQAQQATSNLEQQQANYSRTRAAVISAQKQVGSLKAQRATSVANLRQAEAQVETGELNLSYTRVSAAQPGRVVRLTGAKGQYAQAGQGLAMFVPDEIWITANYKETQITDMRPGQPVKIRLDAYPDHEITGRIDSLQPGSGTAFSLLPAENATGNYVKVVQRVPVKIVVDAWPKDVSIGPGMSVVPTATVRPRN